MSHAPERTGKNCLNCGATVAGRYCQVCGQENIVPKETFGNLVLHFFYDITHFDGKFFGTLKYLLFRPGYLSTQYVKGKRVSYLNPVRMYVFTSAIFFLIFFMMANPNKFVHITGDKPFSKKERAALISEFENEYKKGEDTVALRNKIALLHDTARLLTLPMLNALDQKDSAAANEPRTFEEYDSLQQTKPESERDGWLTRMTKRKIVFNEGLRKDPSAVMGEWAEIFLHKLPYLLFVSLPFFAFILKLLYWRRSKEFFYADHAIFSIHHYILSFILLLLCFLLGTVYDLTGLGVFRIIMIIILVIWPVHLYLAMLNFYKQKWFRTFVKFLLLNFFGFITIMILFSIFFLVSLFQLK